MALQDFKRWHWMVLGLLAGVLFGAVRLWSGPSFATEDADTIFQGEFEWAVSGMLHQPTSSLLRVDRPSEQRSSSAMDVTVHAALKGDPPGTVWVTGLMQSFSKKAAEGGGGNSSAERIEEWKPFRYQAMSPYIAFTGAPGTYPSVREYLEALSKDGSLDFSYHYGWWEKPFWTMMLSVGGGFLMIGVIWPAIFNFLNRAGLGRLPAEKTMILSSGKSAPSQKPEKPTEEPELEWAMDSTTDAVPKAEKKPADAPIMELPAYSDDATEANSSGAAQPESEYRGEFYPVIKSKAAD